MVFQAESVVHPVPDGVTSLCESLSHHLVWLSTADGQPVYQNRPFREFTGQVQFDASWRDQLVHADDVARLRDAWAAAFRERQAFTDVCRLRRHDGTWHWFLEGMSPLGSSASPAGDHFIGTFTNVHALKVADETLRELGHGIRTPLQALQQALFVQDMPGVTEEQLTRMRRTADYQVREIARLCDGALANSLATSPK